MKRLGTLLAITLTIIIASLTLTFFIDQNLVIIIVHNQFTSVFIIVALFLTVLLQNSFLLLRRPIIRRNNNGVLMRDLNIVREEMDRADRYQYGLSLVVIRINEIEELSNKYASPVDDILNDMSGLLKSTVRYSDIIMELDRDTLLLVLPNTDLVGAKTVATKINRQINDTEISKFDITVRTASTQHFAGNTVDALINELILSLKEEA
ncbi:response regulator PleD [compost metagenome]